MNFDRLLIIDWSANNQPKTGKDSIWIADADCRSGAISLSNPATRSSAMMFVERAMEEVLEAGGRLFIGLDFAFGYPAGSDFLPGHGQWRDVWHWLGEVVEDADDNVSNRFEVAGKLNRFCGQAGPFWGHPHQHRGRYGGLEPKKPNYSDLKVPERRHIDLLVKGAQPVWKLAYTGSVGSQTLLGIARLQRLRTGRFAEKMAIWPFETRFADDISKPVIVGELYPSLFPVRSKPGEITDEAQVRTVAEKFCEFSREDRFKELLEGPSDKVPDARDAALNYEAWMVGFTDRPVIDAGASVQ